MGFHRCLEAAEQLGEQGVQATVIDLRTVTPLDKETLCQAASKTNRFLVADEDYKGFGLSGELAATLLEGGVTAKFARVCVEETIPYDRRREIQALPNVKRIVDAARGLMQS